MKQEKKQEMGAIVAAALALPMRSQGVQHLADAKSIEEAGKMNLPAYEMEVVRAVQEATDPAMAPERRAAARAWLESHGVPTMPDISGIMDI